MPIEIRQMTVKANVSQEAGQKEEAGRTDEDIDLELLKKELLAACRSMMVELLQDKRER